MTRTKNNQSKRFMLFSMLAAMFSSKGIDEKTAGRRAYHQSFLGGGNPEFSPRKHTVMGYAEQNRLAKKRRKSKMKK